MASPKILKNQPSGPGSTSHTSRETLTRSYRVECSPLTGPRPSEARRTGSAGTFRASGTLLGQKDRQAGHSASKTWTLCTRVAFAGHFPDPLPEPAGHRTDRREQSVFSQRSWPSPGPTVKCPGDRPPGPRGPGCLQNSPRPRVSANASCFLETPPSRPLPGRRRRPVRGLCLLGKEKKSPPPPTPPPPPAAENRKNRSLMC